VSHLYLVALAGVALVVLAVLFEAVTSVARRPKWGAHRHRYLAPVVTSDRREADLPFVGADRRWGRASQVTPLDDAPRHAA
jgi:hypothetical protein